MSDNKRRSLGRGLAALLGDEDEPAEAGGSVARNNRIVAVAALEPNRFQPRREFDEEAIEALAESIRANGLLQPLLVRPIADDGEAAESFEIIAGERRWRAAQRAQLHELPVVVRDLSDREALEVALVENVQRRDLNPLEEAEGYRRLIEEFRHTQEELARIIGKSRSHIANMLRLLQLPERVKRLVQTGAISAGHARALLNAEDIEALAEEVASRGLSVRETEKLAQQVKAAAADASGSRAPRSRAGGEKDPDTRALEDELSAALGLKVSIAARGQGGKLTITYANLDQLDEVIARLRRAPMALAAGE